MTTLPKAKELRPIAEKIITRGKHGTVHARRLVVRWIANRDLVKKLFDEIAPRFTERPGGYLRITKLGPRPGDGAEMAVLELVERSAAAAAAPPPDDKPKKARKAPQPKAPKPTRPTKSAKPSQGAEGKPQRARKREAAG